MLKVVIVVAVCAVILSLGFSPDKSISHSTVPVLGDTTYNVNILDAPVATGMKLRFLSWLLVQTPLGPALRRHLLKNNNFHNLRGLSAQIPGSGHPPLTHPVNRHPAQDIVSKSLSQEQTGKTLLESFTSMIQGYVRPVGHWSDREGGRTGEDESDPTTTTITLGTFHAFVNAALRRDARGVGGSHRAPSAHTRRGGDALPNTPVSSTPRSAVSGAMDRTQQGSARSLPPHDGRYFASVRSPHSASPMSDSTPVRHAATGITQRWHATPPPQMQAPQMRHARNVAGDRGSDDDDDVWSDCPVYTPRQPRKENYARGSATPSTPSTPSLPSLRRRGPAFKE